MGGPGWGSGGVARCATAVTESCFDLLGASSMADLRMLVLHLHGRMEGTWQIGWPYKSTDVEGIYV
jgi:hypothetical protein